MIEKARARHLSGGVVAPMRPTPKPQALPANFEGLTAMELRFVGHLAEGRGNRQIAEELHFSEKTVRNDLSRIYDKLGVCNRLEAVAFCQHHGLLADRGQTSPRVRDA